MALFDTEHATVPLGKNHRIHDLEFASATARAANVYTDADIGKVYRDTDTNTWHLLTAQTAGVGTFLDLSSGGGGGTINVDDKTKLTNFTFGDNPTTLLFTIPAGSKIVSVRLVVMVAFNDLAATASIGDASNSSSLMAIAANDLTAVDHYITNPIKLYGVATALNLYLSAGTSTIGEGFILITYI